MHKNTKKELVFFSSENLSKSEPITNSKILADELGIKHHAIQTLIKENKSDLKDFGKIIILTADENNQGRGRAKKIYSLNEPQSYYILALSKNTEKAKACKKRFVKSFMNLKRELHKSLIKRDSNKINNNRLNDTLSIKRRLEGKELNPVIYSNEARMINNILGIEKGSRDKLTQKEMHDLDCLINKDQILLVDGIEYKKRKEILEHVHLNIVIEELKNGGSK